MMSGIASAVFSNAVTDAACRAFPAPASTIRVGLAAHSRVALPIVLPGSPTALSASVSGQTVTLTWTAPVTGDAPTSYLLERARRAV